MENRIYMLKVCLLMWCVSLFILFIAIKYLSGKRKIEVLGKEKKKISIGLGILLLIISIGASFNITIDFVVFDYKEKVVFVSGINNPGKASIVENKIVTEKDGIFDNFFKSFDIKVGRSYRIKYVPRTKIILEAEEEN